MPYRVPPFSTPLTVRRSTAIYEMHTYWAKKPHEAIERYIRHYTRPGDLVVDPFCGSGGTALAAVRAGRRAVAVDRSPAAAFIAQQYCAPVDPGALRAAGAAALAAVEQELRWIYGARCGRCGGEATRVHTVTERCVPARAAPAGAPVGGAAGKSMSAVAAEPVLVAVRCDACGAREKRALTRDDRARRAAVEREPIPWWVPPHRMMNVDGDAPWGAEWREGRNFRTVAELYTASNLRALACLRAEILTRSPSERHALLFCLTSILLKCSRMMAYNSDGVGRIQKGTYYVPQRGLEVHVGRFFAEAVADMARGYEAIGPHAAADVRVGSATALPVDDGAADYVFTDPPYGGKVQFGELNFVWESWLDLDTRWHADEIVINPARGLDVDHWAAGMRAALAECRRILKPGRALSLCYHDVPAGAWEALQDAFAEHGFIAEDVAAATTIDTAAKTTNQYFHDKVNRRDLVLTWRRRRRARSGVRSGPANANANANVNANANANANVNANANDPEIRFLSRARRLIRAYLTAHPGATRDRIFDHMASRLLREGRMKSHDFDALLAEVAEARGTDARGAARWTVRPLR